MTVLESIFYSILEDFVFKIIHSVLMEDEPNYSFLDSPIPDLPSSIFVCDPAVLARSLNRPSRPLDCIKRDEIPRNNIFQAVLAAELMDLTDIPVPWQ